MSEFETVLRVRVTAAHEGLTAAREAGHDHKVDLHVSRLRDLLELAGRHDVDTTGWVDPAMLVTQPYRD